jgi:hypothetical protein
MEYRLIRWQGYAHVGAHLHKGGRATDLSSMAIGGGHVASKEGLPKFQAIRTYPQRQWITLCVSESAPRRPDVGRQSKQFAHLLGGEAGASKGNTTGQKRSGRSEDAVNARPHSASHIANGCAYAINAKTFNQARICAIKCPEQLGTRLARRYDLGWQVVSLTGQATWLIRGRPHVPAPLGDAVQDFHWAGSSKLAKWYRPECGRHLGTTVPAKCQDP